MGVGEDKPHYLEHRERLRQRILDKGAQSLADYEVIEYLLTSALPRRDVKPIAKQLIARFGSLAGVLAADARDLADIAYVKDSAVATFKIAHEAAKRMAREELADKPVISSWDQLLAYCRIALGREAVERFHLLFLDRKNRLIADEAQQRGTVDHTPVYPREVVKRALELGASALILVHNHPSGDPTPSAADIAMTREVREAAEKLGISVHDHVVIAKSGHASFRALGLL
ncbi:MAG: DNA repair protein RadC [Rhodospirillales bacterium]|nr:DNA repair protein RadC [Rhodospirillales bacterium]